jgi:hypothetical protein
MRAGLHGLRAALLGLVVPIFAVLVVPVSAAGASFTLPYALTFHATGRITGSFGGIPVQGTFEASAVEGAAEDRIAVEGVFTLTVDGKAFVMGLYQCTSVDCGLIGEEVLGRPKRFLVLTRALTGTIRGSLRGLYPSHAAWVKGVEEWGKINLQTMPLGELVAAAARLRASSTRPAAVLPTEQANRQAKNNGTTSEVGA